MTDQDNTTKIFDARAIGTLTTGIVLIDFSRAHESAEHILGHPIWTHEFVDPAISTAIRNAVLAYYPSFPTKAPAEWEAFAAELQANYPQGISLPRGSSVRRIDPLSSLAQFMDRRK